MKTTSHGWVPVQPETWVPFQAESTARFTTDQVYCRPAGQNTWILVFHLGEVRLGPDLILAVSEHFGVVDRKVTTETYFYVLKDTSGAEVIAYHWHPKLYVPTPHLHLGQGSRVMHSRLAKVHLPTGAVDWDNLVWLVEQLLD